MVFGSATHQVEIVSGTDYTPTVDTVECPIYKFVVTKTNASAVTIVSLGGTSVVWPTGSLIMGTQFEIMVKSITWTGTDASFIGFKLPRAPFGMLTS